MCSHMCAGTGGQGRSSIHSRLWAGHEGRWATPRSWLPPAEYKRGLEEAPRDPEEIGREPDRGKSKKTEDGRKAVRMLEGDWRPIGDR